jgi:hypothetical protein
VLLAIVAGCAFCAGEAFKEERSPTFVPRRGTAPGGVSATWIVARRRRNKFRFGLGGAFIGFGGKEVAVQNYEVLVSQDGLRM